METLGIGSRVNLSSYGEGVICGIRYKSYLISFPGRGVEEVEKDFAGLEVIEQVNEVETIPVKEVEMIVSDLLEKYADITHVVQLGDRWKKGKLILQPFSETLAAKELPMESFFHKIVMLRDRLRVMEQKINSHKVLTDEEKVEMQQYITRIYGSLTSFNVLFKYKEDQFVGQKES